MNKTGNNSRSYAIAGAVRVLMLAHMMSIVGNPTRKRPEGGNFAYRQTAMHNSDHEMIKTDL